MNMHIFYEYICKPVYYMLDQHEQDLVLNPFLITQFGFFLYERYQWHSRNCRFCYDPWWHFYGVECTAQLDYSVLLIQNLTNYLCICQMHMFAVHVLFFWDLLNYCCRMLLWHGSRLTNMVGILSSGLRVAPPEAPVTGYMVRLVSLSVFDIIDGDTTHSVLQ